jgi:hypothetical protein
MIAVVAAFGLYALTGFCILCWAGIDRPALAPATGLATIGILLATAATIGIQLDPWVLCAGLVALGTITLIRGKLPHRTPRPTLPATILAAWIVLQAAVAGHTPLGGFDGLVTWAYKAHALLAYGTPDSPPFDPALNPGPHPEYPILWPELQANVLRMHHGYDDGLLRAHALVALGCLLLGAYALLADRCGRWWALAFIAPFAASPVVVANASAGNADAILAGMLAIALVATVRGLTEPEDARLLLLAGLCAGAAVLTKNEGLLGVVAILAAAAVVTRRRVLLALAAAAAVVYVPWRVFRSAHHLTDADFTLTSTHLRDRLHELPGIMVTIAGRVLAPTAWGAATILAVILLVAARGRLRAIAVTWAVLLGAGLTLSYLATSLDPGVRLTRNAERTTLQLVLGLLCLAALALRRRDSA